MTLHAISTTAGVQSANQSVPATSTGAGTVGGHRGAVRNDRIRGGPWVSYPGDQPPTHIGSGLTPKAQHCFGIQCPVRR
jgi:hypothetical protein